MRFTHDPSSRNSITPEAMLAAIPSAAESRSASWRRHLPAASAAPNTPHTAVACQPRAWKRPGAAMPRRIIPSDPATKAISASRPDSFSLSAMASTVGVSTAETWQTESAWVSSKSRPWASAPLTSAAWAAPRGQATPRTGKPRSPSSARRARAWRGRALRGTRRGRNRSCRARGGPHCSSPRSACPARRDLAPTRRAGAPPASRLLPSRERHGGRALGGDLVPLVLRAELDVHHGLPAFLALGRDDPAAPRHVADQIVTPHLRGEPTQLAVIAHPVRRHVAEPCHALRAVVISSRDADRPREGLVPVHALRRLGHAEGVGNAERRVPLEEVESQAVSAHVEAAPALHEGNHRGDCEWALADGGQRLAHLHVLPEPRLGPANILLAIGAADLLDLGVGIAMCLGGLVFPPLARRIPLGAKAPRVGFTHELAALIRERRAIDLLDGAAGERRGLFREVLEHALPDDAVPLADGAVPTKVRASIHGMNAGEPAHVAGDDAIHGEEDGGRRQPCLRPMRIPVADAVRPVADGVRGGDFDVRLRPPNGLADPRAEGGEGLGRDRGESARRGHGANCVHAPVAGQDVECCSISPCALARGPSSSSPCSRRDSSPRAPPARRATTSYASPAFAPPPSGARPCSCAWASTKP